MRTLLLLFLLFTGSRCTPATKPIPSDSTIVYICDSPNGKKYHFDPNCKGLRNCSHRVIKMTLAQAKKRGKTLCGYEK